MLKLLNPLPHNAGKLALWFVRKKYPLVWFAGCAVSVYSINGMKPLSQYIHFFTNIIRFRQREVGAYCPGTD